jgi:hypothetical protein
VYAAVIAACGAIPAAGAAEPPVATCAFREEPMPDAPAAAATAKKDQSRVTLLAVLPAEGAEVRADSVVEIDVDYHVANFAPEKYLLLVRFPTGAFGTTGPDEPDGPRYLHSPSGKVHLCVPLAEMYASRTVRWPLSFVVSINEQFPGHSRVLTDSRSVQLNSVDMPADALKRQESAMPEDVQRAVMTLFAYVEHQGAAHKVCPERFPDMQARSIKVFRAWEARNAAHIRQIQEMQYAALLESLGKAAPAANAFDAARAATIGYLNGLKEPELRKYCETVINALSDETSDVPTASAANFKIVQKYLADKSKPEAAK